MELNAKSWAKPASVSEISRPSLCAGVMPSTVRGIAFMGRLLCRACGSHNTPPREGRKHLVGCCDGWSPFHLEGIATYDRQPLSARPPPLQGRAFARLSP